MSARRRLRLGTRGSELALRQAAVVREALTERRYEVELVEVETTGDRIRDELIHRLGKTGAFVRSLDERVLNGDLDGAIHSMKDMPTDSPEELIVAGIPRRATPGDVLVTPDGRSLSELPDGATVGTASLRRRAQILARRPTLQVEPLRGNVDTRLEKLLAPHRQREHDALLEEEEEEEEQEGSSDEGGDDAEAEDGIDGGPAQEWFEGLSEIERRSLERRVEEEYDAIVLAEAGLERSGLAHQVPTEPLDVSESVPAPGQGAIAVTAADDSEASRILHEVLDHHRTRVETTVERIVLAELGGGCIAPIGVHAIVQGEQVRTTAQVLGTDGTETVRGTRGLPIERYAREAREFAADLRSRGAADLIEAARVDAGEREAPREEEDEAADGREE